MEGFMDLSGFPTFKLADGRTVLAPVNSTAMYEMQTGQFIKTGTYYQQIITAYKMLSVQPGLSKVNQFAVWDMAKLYVEGALSPFKASTILQAYGADPNVMKLGGGGGGGGTGRNTADEVRSLTALISDMASQLGIPFTPEQIAGIASIAQKQGWGKEQIYDELLKDVDWFKLNAGTLKTSAANYKTIGQQYLVNLSDSSIQNWALRLAKGEMTEETILQSIKESAKVANPWLADYIDKGLSPMDVLAPNRDFVAQNLEINANELDLMDQKTLNMLTKTNPDGTRVLASQGDMLKNVRQDDRWKSTSNAKDLTAGMASLLAKVFGRSVF